jgi:hypothetical protein
MRLFIDNTLNFIMKCITPSKTPYILSEYHATNHTLPNFVYDYNPNDIVKHGSMLWLQFICDNGCELKKKCVL